MNVLCKILNFILNTFSATLNVAVEAVNAVLGAAITVLGEALDGVLGGGSTLLTVAVIGALAYFLWPSDDDRDKNPRIEGRKTLSFDEIEEDLWV